MNSLTLFYNDNRGLSCFAIEEFFVSTKERTLNPLYTDIRYNDKTRYNGNLNETDP